MRQSITLIVNALYYLESVGTDRTARPGRDTPPAVDAEWAKATPAKRRKLRSNLTRDGYAVVYLMGRELAGAGGPRTGSEMRAHWRRGHWRNQPHGPGRSEVKRIWLKPTLVGAAEAPPDMPGRIYMTGTSPDQKKR